MGRVGCVSTHGHGSALIMRSFQCKGSGQAVGHRKVEGFWQMLKQDACRQDRCLCVAQTL